MPGAPVETVVMPWYRQFYLRRGDADWAADQISDDGYERGLEAVGGFVYVGTTMYGSPTTVTAVVHAEDPGPPASTADRVAEARVDGSGDIAILNWNPGEEPVARVAVPDGPLHIRASWFGVDEAAAHPDQDVGGRDLSPERVAFDAWPIQQGS